MPVDSPSRATFNASFNKSWESLDMANVKPSDVKTRDHLQAVLASDEANLGHMVEGCEKINRAAEKASRIATKHENLSRSMTQLRRHSLEKTAPSGAKTPGTGSPPEASNEMVHSRVEQESDTSDSCLYNSTANVMVVADRIGNIVNKADDILSDLKKQTPPNRFRRLLDKKGIKVPTPGHGESPPARRLSNSSIHGTVPVPSLSGVRRSRSNENVRSVRKTSPARNVKRTTSPSRKDHRGLRRTNSMKASKIGTPPQMSAPPRNAITPNSTTKSNRTTQMRAHRWGGDALEMSEKRLAARLGSRKVKPEPEEVEVPVVDSSQRSATVKPTSGIKQTENLTRSRCRARSPPSVPTERHSSTGATRRAHKLEPTSSSIRKDPDNAIRRHNSIRLKSPESRPVNRTIAGRSKQNKHEMDQSQRDRADDVKVFSASFGSMSRSHIELQMSTNSNESMNAMSINIAEETEFRSAEKLFAGPLVAGESPALTRVGYEQEERILRDVLRTPVLDVDKLGKLLFEGQFSMELCITCYDDVVSKISNVFGTLDPQRQTQAASVLSRLSSEIISPDEAFTKICSLFVECKTESLLAVILQIICTAVKQLQSQWDTIVLPTVNSVYNYLLSSLKSPSAVVRKHSIFFFVSLYCTFGTDSLIFFTPLQDAHLKLCEFYIRKSGDEFSTADLQFEVMEYQSMS